MSKEKDYVIARMEGNLGNWIFGYMFAYVYADKHGINNVYVTPEIPEYFKQMRYYSKLKNTIFRNIHLKMNHPQSISIYSPQLFYQEEDFSYLNGMSGFMFSGAVQYYPLYKDYRNDFIRIFGPTDDIRNEIYNLYGDLNEVVGFNIRRGDFLDWSNYWVYDENEINYILKTYCPNKRVIITSDDIEWCKQNINHPDIIFADKQSDKYNKMVIDFYLNMFCGENIISAGSSFSWLGAWMNEVHGGECNKVYSPEYWLKEVIELEKGSDIMVLEPWTKIKLENRFR